MVEALGYSFLASVLLWGVFGHVLSLGRHDNIREMWTTYLQTLPTSNPGIFCGSKFTLDL